MAGPHRRDRVEDRKEDLAGSVLGATPPRPGPFRRPGRTLSSRTGPDSPRPADTGQAAHTGADGRTGRTIRTEPDVVEASGQGGTRLELPLQGCPLGQRHRQAWLGNLRLGPDPSVSASKRFGRLPI